MEITLPLSSLSLSLLVSFPSSFLFNLSIILDIYQLGLELFHLRSLSFLLMFFQTARKNKKPRSALPFLNEALTTYRTCYGSKHEVVANTLCAIASIYKGFHKYNEAINVNRKAMLIREVV